MAPRTTGFGATSYRAALAITEQAPATDPRWQDELAKTQLEIGDALRAQNNDRDAAHVLGWAMSEEGERDVKVARLDEPGITAQ